MSEIYVSQFNYFKMMKYAELCATEISGFGSVHLDKWGDIEVNEIFPLLEQTCTGTETEAIESSIVSLAQSPYSKRTRVWWHSHVNMGVFWSADDNAVISSLGRLMPHLLSIVVNKKGEYLCRFDYFKPYRCTVDKIKLNIDYNFPEKELAIIQKEVETKVKPKVYATNQNNRAGYYSHYWRRYVPADDEWWGKDFQFAKQEKEIKDDKKIPDLFKDDKKPPFSLDADLILTAQERTELVAAGFIYDETLKRWTYPFED